MSSHPNCINCGQRMVVASANSFRCKSCGMIELGATTQGQQQQQPQPKGDKKE
jgi:tRNA(Ile2) C34 agmatinyltransferase TiaS